MINIKYKEWYEVDVEDDYGFRKKDASRWYEKDFTIMCRIKTDFSSIKKEPDESTACCILGKPGMHLGLMATIDGYFRFDFWTQKDEESEPQYHNCFIPRRVKQDDEFIDICVTHNLAKKEVNLFVFQQHNENFVYTKKLYEDPWLDYSKWSTFIGCAYDDYETGYPHNNFWTGDIQFVKILDKFLEKDDIEDLYFFDYELVEDYMDEFAYFKLDGEKRTYCTLYDITGNNNHGRWKRNFLMQYYNKLRNTDEVRGIV